MATTFYIKEINDSIKLKSRFANCLLIILLVKMEIYRQRQDIPEL